MISLLLLIAPLQDPTSAIVEALELNTVLSAESAGVARASLERTVPATRVDVWARSESGPVVLTVTNLDTERTFSGKGEPPYLHLTFSEPARLRVVVETEAEAPVELRLIARPSSPETLRIVAEIEAAAAETQRLIDAADYASAKARLSSALERIFVHPVEHTEEVQKIVGRLAELTEPLGLDAATVELRRRHLAFFEERLPPGHQNLFFARGNLAAALSSSGDHAASRKIEEELLTHWEKTLPPDHVNILIARTNLAVSLRELGYVDRACELERETLERLAANRSPDDRQLQVARFNYSISLSEAGRLQESRALQELVVEQWERTLPATHPNVLGARQNLAVSLRELGEYEAARAIVLENLERMVRTHPPEELAITRDTLATLLIQQGHWEEGLQLYRDHILPIYERHHGPQSEFTLRAKGNVLIALAALERLEESIPLAEEIVAGFRALWPDYHPDVIRARLSLGVLCVQQGRFERAEGILTDVLSSIRRIDVSTDVSSSDAWLALIPILEAREQNDEARLLGIELAIWLRERAEAVLELGCTPREMESLARQIDRPLVGLIRLCLQQRQSSELLREVFRLCETLRSAHLVAATSLRTRTSTDDPRIEDLHAAVRRARAELASLARESSTAPDENTLVEALRRRELAERALRRTLGSHSADGHRFVTDPQALARRLRPHELAVATWRVLRYEPYRPAAPSTEGAGLIAWVLRPAGSLELVPLGPAEPILELAESWQSGAVLEPRGVRRRRSGAESEGRNGEELLARLLGPLAIDLDETTRLHWAPAGSLAGLPLDALPRADGVVGDRMRVVVHSALSEMAEDRRPPSGPRTLLAIGGVDYGRPAEGSVRAPSDSEGASPLSRTPSDDLPFAPIPATLEEIVEIVRLFESVDPMAGRAVSLTGPEARRAAFESSAPGHRYIHLATHGMFEVPADDATVSALVPSSRCGLVFAGANLQRGGPEVLTAEELTALDLSQCELIVLSACETGLGLERGGQGLASLQRAVLAAGARSAITSVWPVPDDVTRELMTEFYRQLWEEGRGKSEALWLAKQHIRSRKDASGRPRYALRDWAGWILSGDSDR